MVAKYTDVSIDLETLGTRPGSVITQIGLFAFSTGPLASPNRTGLQIHVQAQSQIDQGFLVDWSTLAWWMHQEPEAKEALIRGQDTAATIQDALEQVSRWFREEFPHGTPQPLVWGNGATFDITMLEIAYSRFSMFVPWSYRNVRDIRTLAALVPEAQNFKPAPTVEHIAMADAVAQGLWVRNLLGQINQPIVLPPEPAFQP